MHMSLSLYETLREEASEPASLRRSLERTVARAEELDWIASAEAWTLGDDAAPEPLEVGKAARFPPGAAGDGALRMEAFDNDLRFDGRNMIQLVRLDRDPVALLRFEAAKNPSEERERLLDLARCVRLTADDLFRRMARERIDSHYHRLNRLVDTAKTFFVLVDGRGDLLEVRGNLCGTRAEEYLPKVGRSVEELLPEVSPALRKALKGAPATCQSRLPDSDRILHIDCAPFDPDPFLSCRAELVVTDVTLRVRAQRDLRMLHDMGREIEGAGSLREAASSALPLICDRLRECCVEIWWPESGGKLARRELFMSSRPDLTETVLRTFPGLSVPYPDSTFVADCLAAEETRLTDCVEERHPALLPYLRRLAAEGFARALSVPVPLLGDSQIVLVVYLPEEGHDLEYTRSFMETQATEFGLFLARRESELVQREQRRKLRALSVRLSEVRERERKKFFRSVHDTVGHELGISRIKLSELLRGGGYDLEESLRSQLEQIETNLKNAIRMARDLSVEFSPPILHDAGLFPALKWLADIFRQKHDIRVDLELEDEVDRVEIAKNLQILLFNSIRECLMNVITHAEADHIRMKAGFTGRDDLFLKVFDNGKGFDPDAVDHSDSGREGAFGLFNMRQSMEHAGGGFRCDSFPGEGTIVTFQLPRNLLTKETP